MKRTIIIFSIVLVIYCLGYVSLYRFEIFNESREKYDREWSGLDNAPLPPRYDEIPRYRAWYIRFRFMNGGRKDGDGINTIINAAYSPLNYIWRKIEK